MTPDPREESTNAVFHNPLQVTVHVHAHHADAHGIGARGITHWQVAHAVVMLAEVMTPFLWSAVKAAFSSTTAYAERRTGDLVYQCLYLPL